MDVLMVVDFFFFCFIAIHFLVDRLLRTFLSSIGGICGHFSFFFFAFAVPSQ